MSYPVFLYNLFVKSKAVSNSATPMVLPPSYATFTTLLIEGMTCSSIDTPND